MPKIKSTFKIVDVITLFDVEAILINHPELSHNPSAATPLKDNGKDTVFMVTTTGNVIAGQAGNELNIGVDAGDIIRFRTVSLTNVSDYKCFIHHTNVSHGAELLSPDDFEFQCPNINEPYPAPGWPHNGVDSEKRADYFWQTNPVSKGQATYQFVVAIYDRHANLKGYVTWDPFITINND